MPLEHTIESYIKSRGLRPAKVYMQRKQLRTSTNDQFIFLLFFEAGDLLLHLPLLLLGQTPFPHM